MAATPSYSQLGYIRESAFNTIPATPGFKVFRNLSNSLAGKPQYEVSEERISTRNVPDTVYVGRDASGDIAIEWIHDAYDDALEGLFYNAWEKSPENNGSSQITAVTTTQYTVTGGGTWRQYMLCRATGFSQAGNNRVFVVGAASNATTIIMTGGVAETPSGGGTYRTKCIGFEGPSGEITATATGLGRTATLIDYTNFPCKPGQWVFVGGAQTANKFASATNYGLCRVSMATAAAAAALTFDIRPTGWTTDAGTGKNIRIYFTDFLRNGTTKFSYAFERIWSDITQYEYFTGCRIASGMVDVKPRGKVTGGFSVVATDYVSSSGTRFSGATTVSASADAIMNTSSHVIGLLENNVPVTANLATAFSIKWDNKSFSLPAIGSEVAVGVEADRFEVTGTMETYFDDATMLDKVKNSTVTSLVYGSAYKDGTNGGIVFDFPKVKLTDGSPANQGGANPVTIPLAWQALEYTRPIDSAKFTATCSQFELIGV